MSEDQIKKFLIEIQNNKKLLDQVLSVGTADEIAKIANDSGFKFTGSELKNISSNVVNGVKIKSQDITPSYNCLLYTSPSPRDLSTSRMPSSA